ncbi:hypothetical protein MRX96_036650 [Rhipicephalus microplus]
MARQDEVTERLDALIFGDASPAILAREMGSSAFKFDKSTATVEVKTEDTYKERDDDEVMPDDDKDPDFTGGLFEDGPCSVQRLEAGSEAGSEACEVSRRPASINETGAVLWEC